MNIVIVLTLRVVLVIVMVSVTVIIIIRNNIFFSVKIMNCGGGHVYN